MFRDEVAQGRAEAETGLRERFGLVPHGLPELNAANRGVVSTGSTDERRSTDEGRSTDDDKQEGDD
jgi:hypothetical protein